MLNDYGVKENINNPPTAATYSHRANNDNGGNYKNKKLFIISRLRGRWKKKLIVHNHKNPAFERATVCAQLAKAICAISHEIGTNDHKACYAKKYRQCLE